MLFRSPSRPSPRLRRSRARARRARVSRPRRRRVRVAGRRCRGRTRTSSWSSGRARCTRSRCRSSRSAPTRPSPSPASSAPSRRACQGQSTLSQGQSLHCGCTARVRPLRRDRAGDLGPSITTGRVHATRPGQTAPSASPHAFQPKGVSLCSFVTALVASTARERAWVITSRHTGARSHTALATPVRPQTATT